MIFWDFHGSYPLENIPTTRNQTQQKIPSLQGLTLVCSNLGYTNNNIVVGKL
jgi:hypothetical protein